MCGRVSEGVHSWKLNSRAGSRAALDFSRLGWNKPQANAHSDPDPLCACWSEALGCYFGQMLAEDFCPNCCPNLCPNFCPNFCQNFCPNFCLETASSKGNSTQRFRSRKSCARIIFSVFSQTDTRNYETGSDKCCGSNRAKEIFDIDVGWDSFCSLATIAPKLDTLPNRKTENYFTVLNASNWAAVYFLLGK